VTPRAQIKARLADFRARYEGGDGWALLEAAKFCWLHRLAAPRWVAQNAAHAISRRQAHLVDTLDAGFGLSPMKHRRAKFKRQQLQFEVYAAVEGAKRARIGRSEWLFEVLADELGIGTGTVKDYLASARREITTQRAEQRRLDPSARVTVGAFTCNARLQDRLVKRLQAEARKRQKT
jgi:hypothetical protein